MSDNFVQAVRAFGNNQPKDSNMYAMSWSWDNSEIAVTISQAGATTLAQAIAAVQAQCDMLPQG